MSKEQEPSGEMQVRLNGLSLEELQSYLESLYRLQDEGQNKEGLIYIAEKELQLKIERGVDDNRQKDSPATSQQRKP